MKPKLVVLSDLWGFPKTHPWLSHYQALLRPHFEWNFYDVIQLGQINTQPYEQEALHHQLVDFGIDNAVQNLLERETGEGNVLAFSIGGTIAWRAALAGWNIKNCWAISATRLRYETQLPNGNFHLTYGELDTYRPSTAWFAQFSIPAQIISSQGHNLYRHPDLIPQFCTQILSSIQT